MAATNVSPRSDLHDGVGWIVLGTAILIGSLMMDRLEAQHINPNTVPGLLPGLLGIAMILLGTMLGIRSLRRGALHLPPKQRPADYVARRNRLILVLVLCLAFGVGMVGHGLPFWLASAVFVTVSILALQYSQRKAEGQALTARAVAVAAAIGIGAAAAITLIFQVIFLVRLP